MSRVFSAAAAVFLAGLAAACAGVTMAAPGQTRQTVLGAVYTDAAGMTLYTYDKDKPGASVCDGLCATFWPPVVAPAEAKPSGAFTIIARGDGSRQWAYKGMPLYGYLNDSNPGDVTGNGADGVWHVARP